MSDENNRATETLQYIIGIVKRGSGIEIGEQTIERYVLDYVKALEDRVVYLRDEAAEHGNSAESFRDGICEAIGMIQAHLDEYHDCDIPENTETYPERKKLENIMYHLMGTIAGDEPTARFTEGDE